MSRGSASFRLYTVYGIQDYGNAVLTVLPPLLVLISTVLLILVYSLQIYGRIVRI
jgi:hypothetical protein